MITFEGDAGVAFCRIRRVQYGSQYHLPTSKDRPVLLDAWIHSISTT